MVHGNAWGEGTVEMPRCIAHASPASTPASIYPEPVGSKTVKASATGSNWPRVELFAAPAFSRGGDAVRAAADVPVPRRLAEELTPSKSATSRADMLLAEPRRKRSCRDEAGEGARRVDQLRSANGGRLIRNHSVRSLNIPQRPTCAGRTAQASPADHRESLGHPPSRHQL